MLAKINSLSDLLSAVGLDLVADNLRLTLALLCFIVTVIASIAAVAKSTGGAQQAKKRFFAGLGATLLILMSVSLIDWGWGKISANDEKIKNAPTEVLDP